MMVGAFAGGFRIQKYRIDSQTARPNQGIIRSLKYSVINFLCFLFIAIVFAWIMDFPEDFLSKWNPILICIGFDIGLLSALGARESSGLVCIQHFILRLILHRKNYIPWNYAHFLDYAAKRGFLQKVGSGYIFIHRMLLEHFARMT